MKTAVLCASIAGLIAAAANAADINWQTPLTISGTSDVSVNGTLVGTWGPGDDWEPGEPGRRSDYFPVNGVTFAAYGSGPFASFISSSGLNDRYGGYGNPGTSDSNYNLILTTSIYSYDASMSLTWGGMTAGNTYELEFWVNDGRNIGQARSETLTGGANTSAALSYGSDGNGFGQFIVGTFVADVSGQQTISISGYSSGANPSAQVTLMQLRDITPVPEPATIALAGMGACAMFYGFRRKNRAV